MEIMVVSRVSSRVSRPNTIRQANAPKPQPDVAQVLQAQEARRTYEQFKFQMQLRNLSNPLFNVHL